MRNREPSGQTARLLKRENHPRYPAHVVITAGAETFCRAFEPGFSGNRELILKPGQQVTSTVARDIFANKQVGHVVDGAWLAYYAMRGEPVLEAVA